MSVQGGARAGARHAGRGVEAFLEISAAGATLWSLERPALYKMTRRIESASGSDSQSVRFGFRQIDFTSDGFHLNGPRIKLRGLNRHQSFPYVGYALGRAAQERAAEILKPYLRTNMVPTSPSPASNQFFNP